MVLLQNFTNFSKKAGGVYMKQSNWYFFTAVFVFFWQFLLIPFLKNILF